MTLKISALEQISSLRSSADRSLAEIENAFIRYGSGRYFSLTPTTRTTIVTTRSAIVRKARRRNGKAAHQPRVASVDQ